MKISTLVRHHRQAAKSIWRNGWTSFSSINSLSITLFILGIFFILALNIGYFTNLVEKQVEVRVFLQNDLEDSKIKDIESDLKNIEGVKETTFISKEEGLKQFKESFGEKSYLFESLEGENPLSHVYVVKAVDPKNTERIAEIIKSKPYVSDVSYSTNTVRKLFDITNIVRNVVLVLIILLSFTSMFLISNTIKMTIMTRRKEIEIMKLVGSTNGFIRWPFFIEGIVMGIAGSILPISSLFIGYHYLLKQIELNFSLSFIKILPLNPFIYQISGLLVIIGVFIGIWGSLISIRKFLKI